jgi:hypothetical protein
LLDRVASRVCCLVDLSLGFTPARDVFHRDDLNTTAALNMDRERENSAGFLGHGLLYVDINHIRERNLLRISAQSAFLEVEELGIHAVPASTNAAQRLAYR